MMMKAIRLQLDLQSAGCTNLGYIDGQVFSSQSSNIHYAILETIWSNQCNTLWGHRKMYREAKLHNVPSIPSHDPEK